jgi:hypothetical protein
MNSVECPVMNEKEELMEIGMRKKDEFRKSSK